MLENTRNPVEKSSPILQVNEVCSFETFILLSPKCLMRVSLWSDSALRSFILHPQKSLASIKTHPAITAPTSTISHYLLNFFL